MKHFHFFSISPYKEYTNLFQYKLLIIFCFTHYSFNWSFCYYFYQQLLILLQTSWFFAVEIDARGYCTESLRFCFRALGFQTKVTKSALKQFSIVAVQSSFFIWLSRDSKIPDKNFVSENTPGSLGSEVAAVCGYKAAKMLLLIQFCKEINLQPSCVV